MARVQITGVQFSDCEEVVIPSHGVVLLVGPNNAGKSQFLKDLERLMSKSNYVGRVITSVDYKKESHGEDRQWIDDRAPRVTREGVDEFQRGAWGSVG